MDIIGLTGKMGNGKNSVGLILCKKYGYEEASFAFELRMEVSEAIRSKTFPEGVPEHIRQYLSTCDPEDVWLKPTPDGMRIALQYWGTDLRRAEDEDYWVKLLFANIKGTDCKYVVTDVRFPNEAKAIAENGGKLWRVCGRKAANNGIPGHRSEAYADAITCDCTIKNTGTLEILEKEVDRAFGECFKAAKSCNG